MAATAVTLLALTGLAVFPPAQAAAYPTLSVSRKAPVAGDMMRFSVTPPKSWRGKSARVMYRKSPSASWQELRRVTVPSSGALVFRQRAQGVGSQAYRAAVPNLGRSSNAAVTVFKYFYLSDLDPIATEIEGRAGGCTGGCAGFYADSATIAGRTYSRSWITRMDAGGRRSTSTWNASYKCRSFDATVGLTDDSDSTTAQFTLNLGGDDILLASPQTGQGVHVAEDVRGVFRFTLAASNPGTGKTKAAWGNARLLCKGRP